MKNYKKYIFDLDYTILIPDWSKEDDYLRMSIPLDEQEEFFKQKQAILNRYELEFQFKIGLTKKVNYRQE